MTTIYIDTLFMINAIIDYLLLLCSARLAGEPLERLRFGAGALLGGGYAAAIFLPGGGFLYHPLCRMCAAVLMVLVAFSGSRRLLRQIFIFFALSCAFGGGVLAVSLLGGQGMMLGNGIFYSGVDLKIVLVSAAGCYCMLSLLFQRWGRHTVSSGELEPVTMELLGKAVTLTALRDSGNTLTDPITGRQALVAEGDSLKGLFPDGEIPNLHDPAGALEQINRHWPGRGRILPYRAVGVERGILAALRMDRVVIGGTEQKGKLVALSPTPVSDGGNYQVLAGADEYRGGAKKDVSLEVEFTG